MALTNLTKGTVVGSEGGSATTNLAQGLAKAWLNLDGTATFDSSDTEIRDSFNMTTITDEGTGDYSASFTNNMGNANYSLTDGSYSGGTTRGTMLSGNSTNSQTASSFRQRYGLSTADNSDGTADGDVSFVRIAVHGDLA
jgi:hypothetical protein